MKSGHRSTRRKQAADSSQPAHRYPLPDTSATENTEDTEKFLYHGMQTAASDLSCTLHHASVMVASIFERLSVFSVFSVAEVKSDHWRGRMSNGEFAQHLLRITQYAIRNRAHEGVTLNIGPPHCSLRVFVPSWFNFYAGSRSGCRSVSRGEPFGGAGAF